MLQITIPARKETVLWNEIIEEFVTIPGSKEYTLQLEHSLVSLHKWESKWHKSFLSNAKNLTDEETIDYIRCMTITQNVPSTAYDGLTDKNIEDVTSYINDPMTATWFAEEEGGGKPNREVVTAELIYYWMFTLSIPYECRKWHLNSLLTQIRVCDIKNRPPKKMSKKSIFSRNAALNAARKKKFNTTG